MTNLNKNHKIKYSFLKILTGSDLSQRRLAMLEIKSPNPGPVIWLTGCVHGDEVGGIVIIQEIFKRLRSGLLLNGTVYAFPLMNPMGFEIASRHIIMSEEDLNRSFPGNKIGSLAERIADKIFNTIKNTNPALVLDLHDDWLQSIPYTLIDPSPGLKHKAAYEKAKQISHQTGFLVIDEQEVGDGDRELEKTLSGSLLQNDIPALTLEVGGSNIVSAAFNEKDIQDGVRSVWQILAYLKMVKPIKEEFNFKLPEKLKGKILRYSHQPIASKSGIIRYIAKPGGIIKKGQPVAKIYNIFGKLQETLAAQADGVLLGHSDYSISYPGAEVLAFALI